MHDLHATPPPHPHMTDLGHSPSSVAYVLLDVFTHRPFGGNPLAVFPDADGLDAGTMQTIARELNLSETVFLVSPSRPAAVARARIFTPAMELPFAGHPTVGAAAVLASRRGIGPGMTAELLLEEAAGPVSARVAVGDAGRTTVALTAPALSRPVAGSVPSRADVARMLNIPASALAEEAVASIGMWSAGVPFTIVPVRDGAALAAVYLDEVAWRDTSAKSPAPHIYVTTMEDWGAGRDVRVRMFAPAMGIVEDPATGAGAAALAGWLADRQALRDGTAVWVVRQGEEMGRPSRIVLEVQVSDGELRDVRVAGDCIVVGRGELYLGGVTAGAASTTVDRG